MLAFKETKYLLQISSVYKNIASLLWLLVNRATMLIILFHLLCFLSQFIIHGSRLVLHHFVLKNFNLIHKLILKNNYKTKYIHPPFTKLKGKIKEFFNSILRHLYSYLSVLLNFELPPVSPALLSISRVMLHLQKCYITTSFQK